MKVKSLALLLSAGLFAATASATSVVLYGSLDVAVQGQNVKTTNSSVATNEAFLDGKPSAELLAAAQLPASYNLRSNAKSMRYHLAPGYWSGSYLGFKGVANVTPSSTVGFSLETGFSPLDGSLTTNNILFNRGALVYVEGHFGRISFGYQPDLASNFGPNNIFAQVANPFVNARGGLSADNASSAQFMVKNAFVYVSPKIAGFDVAAFFSPDVNGTGNSFKQNTRVGEVALRFQQGPVALAVMGSRVFFPEGDLIPQTDSILNKALMDPQALNITTRSIRSNVRAAANVTLGSVKVFVSGQKQWRGENELSGWAASLGSSLTLGNNTVIASVNYHDFKLDKVVTQSEVRDGVTLLDQKTYKLENKRLSVELTYGYALSKFATLYVGAEYLNNKDIVRNTQDLNLSNSSQKQLITTDLKQEKVDKVVTGYFGFNYRF